MNTNSKNIGRYQKQVTMPGVNLANNYSSIQNDNEDTKYLKWLDKIESTLRWRKSNYDKDWKRAYAMFNGIHWRDSLETDPSSDNVRDRITVNLTMSNVLSIVPFLASTKPTFVCKPRKPEKDLVAKLKSEILNYEYEQRRMHKQAKSAIYDCVEIGHGIVKVGYALELDESKLKDEKSIQYESYIKEDSPYIKRICPLHFLIDPCASENSLETAEWCAEIFFKPLKDILSNTKYNQSVIRKIKSGLYIPGTKSTVFDNLSDAGMDVLNDSYGTDPQKINPDYDLVVCYECWSKRDKKYYIFISEIPEPILEKDWPYEYIDNFPYIKVDYIPIQDCIYGVGLPFTIEDQQFEINRVRTSAFEHRRRFNRKYTAVENAISEPEANKLVNGPDGTIIFVKQQNAVLPIQEANLSQDSYAVESMIKDDIKNITGNDSLIQGGNLPSRTTSGEVQTRTNLFRLKLDDRADAIDQFILDIGVQVLQHIENNYRTDRIVALVGLKGINWETLSTSDIKEQMDVSMETISAPKVDPMVDRQQKSALWQTSIQALPLVQAGLLKIDYNQLFAWLIESFDYQDVGKFFDFSLVVQPELQQVTQQQVTQQPTNYGSQQQNQLANIQQQSNFNPMSLMGQ